MLMAGVDPEWEELVTSEKFLEGCYNDIREKLRGEVIEKKVDPSLLKFGMPGEDLFLVRDWRNNNYADKGFVANSKGRTEMGYPAYEAVVRGVLGTKTEDQGGALVAGLCEEYWGPFENERGTKEIDLHPGRDKVEIDTFNEFVAPEIYDYQRPGKAFLPKHIKLFLMHLVNNDEKEFHILLWWIKMLILGIRANNILILSGRGGTGKTIFYDKLLTNLLGTENITMTDAVNLAKEVTNKELQNKILVAMEETGVTNFSINKMKQMAADWIRIRPMHCDPIKVRNRTNLLIITNPDTGKIHANANERRFWAVNTTSVTLEERFGPQSEVVEDIKSGKEVGNFYAWLKEYEPRFPLTSSEIKVNNRKFFELVIDAYADRGTGEDELLTQMTQSYDTPFPVSTVMYNREGRGEKQPIRRSTVRDFLNGWTEVHPDKKSPGRLFEEQGIWYVKSNIRSIEELTNCQTPGWKYEVAENVEVEPTDVLNIYDDL